MMRSTNSSIAFQEHAASSSVWSVHDAENDEVPMYHLPIAAHTPSDSNDFHSDGAAESQTDTLFTPPRHIPSSRELPHQSMDANREGRHHQSSHHHNHDAEDEVEEEEDAMERKVPKASTAFQLRRRGLERATASLLQDVIVSVSALTATGTPPPSPAGLLSSIDLLSPQLSPARQRRRVASTAVFVPAGNGLGTAEDHSALDKNRYSVRDASEANDKDGMDSDELAETSRPRYAAQMEGAVRGVKRMSDTRESQLKAPQREAKQKTNITTTTTTKGNTDRVVQGGGCSSFLSGFKKLFRSRKNKKKRKEKNASMVPADEAVTPESSLVNEEGTSAKAPPAAGRSKAPDKSSQYAVHEENPSTPRVDAQGARSSRVMDYNTAANSCSGVPTAHGTKNKGDEKMLHGLERSSSYTSDWGIAPAVAVKKPKEKKVPQTQVDPNQTENRHRTPSTSVPQLVSGSRFESSSVDFVVHEEEEEDAYSSGGCDADAFDQEMDEMQGMIGGDLDFSKEYNQDMEGTLRERQHRAQEQSHVGNEQRENGNPVDVAVPFSSDEFLSIHSDLPDWKVLPERQSRGLSSSNVTPRRDIELQCGDKEKSSVPVEVPTASPSPQKRRRVVRGRHALSNGKTKSRSNRTTSTTTTHTARRSTGPLLCAATCSMWPPPPPPPSTPDRATAKASSSASPPPRTPTPCRTARRVKGTKKPSKANMRTKKTSPSTTRASVATAPMKDASPAVTHRFKRTKRQPSNGVRRSSPAISTSQTTKRDHRSRGSCPPSLRSPTCGTDAPTAPVIANRSGGTSYAQLAAKRRECEEQSAHAASLRVSLAPPSMHATRSMSGPLQAASLSKEVRDDTANAPHVHIAGLRRVEASRSPYAGLTWREFKAQFYFHEGFVLHASGSSQPHIFDETTPHQLPETEEELLALLLSSTRPSCAACQPNDRELDLWEALAKRLNGAEQGYHLREELYETPPSWWRPAPKRVESFGSTTPVLRQSHATAVPMTLSGVGHPQCEERVNEEKEEQGQHQDAKEETKSADIQDKKKDEVDLPCYAMNNSCDRKTVDSKLDKDGAWEDKNKDESNNEESEEEMSQCQEEVKAEDIELLAPLKHETREGGNHRSASNSSSAPDAKRDAEVSRIMSTPIGYAQMGSGVPSTVTLVSSEHNEWHRGAEAHSKQQHSQMVGANQSGINTGLHPNDTSSSQLQFEVDQEKDDGGYSGESIPPCAAHASLTSPINRSVVSSHLTTTRHSAHSTNGPNTGVDPEVIEEKLEELDEMLERRFSNIFGHQDSKNRAKAHVKFDKYLIRDDRSIPKSSPKRHSTCSSRGQSNDSKLKKSTHPINTRGMGEGDVASSTWVRERQELEEQILALAAERSMLKEQLGIYTMFEGATKRRSRRNTPLNPDLRPESAMSTRNVSPGSEVAK